MDISFLITCHQKVPANDMQNTVYIKNQLPVTPVPLDSDSLFWPLWATVLS